MADTDTEFQVALHKLGGFGRFHYWLLIYMIPTCSSGVIVVNTITYILPAVICEFHLSKYEQGLLFSAVYIGMIFGGLIWGAMSDVIGRRKTLLILLSTTFIIETVAVFTFQYWQLFLVKVCGGFVSTGIMTTTYTYVSDFIEAQDKDKMTMGVGMAAALGYFIQPLIAIFTLPLDFELTIIPRLLVLNGWKTFQILCNLILLVGFLLVLIYLTESPAFLLRTGRNEEALEVLKKAYTKNTNKSLDTFEIKSLYLTEESNDKSLEKFSFIREMRLVFCGKYTPTLFVILSCQILSMVAFVAVRCHLATIITVALGIGQKSENNAINQNKPLCTLFETQRIFDKEIDCSESHIHLKPDIYICTTITGFFIAFSFVPTTKLVQKIGKQISFGLVILNNQSALICILYGQNIVVLHYIGGVVVILMPFAQGYIVVVLITIFAVTMQNNLTIGVALILSRSPTTIRGSMVAVVMIGGRLGGILGSQILPVMTEISCTVGFWSIACVNAASLPVMLIFSELRNPLEEEQSALETNNRKKT